MKSLENSLPAAGLLKFNKRILIKVHYYCWYDAAIISFGLLN